ncbi:MAG: 7-cyano-7-deazaguanine synthase QueC [Thermoguttaceae bacterium]|nr:7-cyano-7-deazaguanine synthase QueC [Thermoguttaceae bacterium]MDW8036882.1 7-cyano-7-deazaguanine synthase QueC [Thermoguttaceae bacterium]
MVRPTKLVIATHTPTAYTLPSIGFRYRFVRIEIRLCVFLAKFGGSVSAPIQGKPAVVLLSGGMDSATAAAIAKAEGFSLFGLTVDYGQRNRWELEAASRLAQFLQMQEHRIIRLELGGLLVSALTGHVPVPKDRRPTEIGQGIPVTYVPARNTILLALALGYAEVVGAADIFLGVHALDYSGYPDCRPEFLQAFEHLANLATKAAVEGQLRFRIHAPLLGCTKAEIIRRGVALGLDYRLSCSCYDPTPDGLPCGRCDACVLRRRGFQQAGLEDPLPYQTPLL